MLLMYAIDKDNEDMLKALVARGADPNLKIMVGAGVEQVCKSVKGWRLVSIECTVDVMLHMLTSWCTH